jgi:uncharacterized HAD superfamily protein
MIPMITTSIPNNEYWEKAVQLFLKNPDSIIANPYILSDELNEWMLKEAAIIQQEELEQWEKDRELEQWAEDNAIRIASSHPSWNDSAWIPNWKRK